jgi:hypothetical protein
MPVKRRPFSKRCLPDRSLRFDAAVGPVVARIGGLQITNFYEDLRITAFSFFAQKLLALHKGSFRELLFPKIEYFKTEN